MKKVKLAKTAHICHWKEFEIDNAVKLTRVKTNNFKIELDAVCMSAQS